MLPEYASHSAWLAMYASLLNSGARALQAAAFKAHGGLPMRWHSIRDPSFCMHCSMPRHAAQQLARLQLAQSTQLR